MIRIRPFNKMSYSELRNGYLQQLVKAGAVAFNDEDVLDTTDRSEEGKTTETWKLLNESGYMYKGLKNFLFPKGELCRKNLQKLLAGPEDAPVSLGGNGSYDSLRQYFEEMIKFIDRCRLPFRLAVERNNFLLRCARMADCHLCAADYRVYRGCAVLP